MPPCLDRRRRLEDEETVRNLRRRCEAAVHCAVQRPKRAVPAEERPAPEKRPRRAAPEPTAEPAEQEPELTAEPEPTAEPDPEDPEPTQPEDGDALAALAAQEEAHLCQKKLPPALLGLLAAEARDPAAGGRLALAVARALVETYEDGVLAGRREVAAGVAVEAVGEIEKAFADRLAELRALYDSRYEDLRAELSAPGRTSYVRC